MIQIEVHQRTKFAVSKPRLQKILKKVFRSARMRTSRKLHLGLFFVGESEGKKINKLWRDKNKATDVLSFQGDPRSVEPSLGELVFCVPVLRKQAQKHSLSQRDEFEYLFIHGVLHLLGYEHETSEADAKEMFQIQDRVFDETR